MYFTLPLLYFLIPLSYLHYLFLQGPSVYPIEEMAAGNIVAILGLEVRTFNTWIVLLSRAKKMRNDFFFMYRSS